MACKMNSLFSIGEDFDDEDILGTDWGTHSSSPLPVEGAAAVSSSSLRASSVTHLEPEKNCPREIGASSVAQPKGSTSRNNSQTTAGQTVALSLRQLSTSSSLSSLDYTQTNLPVQQTTAKTELRKPSVSQDDFDDWDIDLADLEEADHQLGQPVKSTTPVSTVTALSSAKVLRPLSAAVPQTSGSTSEHPSAASSIPYPSTTIPSPHPQSVVPQSPGVFPGLTAASPCLRRGPEQMRQPLSTPVSSKHNRGLFESISPAAPPRPLTPSSLHTPVLTNRLVQLVSASNSKKRPRSESNRRRTRRFPGPAGLLPQQPQGQSLDDIVVSVPSTPAHGAVARSPSQCSSSQTEEEDFSGPAWTSMKTEMGLDERNPSCFLHTYSVVMVLRKAALKQLVKNKVPNMAVLLKSLVPTHTDAKAVFKDPTGEMQGTVHRRLLEDRAGDLKPGAVLLLKQVGVFSPSHRNHYLNVTPNNLLRVYSPDGACMSCTQLPPLAMEPVLLSSTPHVLREPVSKMQLLFDEDDDEGHDQEGAAQRSTENQEAVNQSAKQQTPAVAEQDSGWGADDLDELLGELPEDLYSV
ncbi:hypothetical protein NQD34_006169 [Periophthalmus magnuspinnatus]|nr:hypothetical protein NQD34_006169 [Periophthalmus magnuspinnatus]